MLKKTLAIMVVSVMTVLLAACGSSGTAGKESAPTTQASQEPVKSSAGPAELTFYTTTGDPESSFNDTFGNAIRKKFPNYTIKYITRPSGSNVEDFNAQLIASDSGFDIYFNTIGTFERYMLPYQFQTDLTDLVKKHNVDLSKLENTAMDSIKQTSGGKLFGIPVYTTRTLLFYNKAIFDKFGITYPKDDMTWDDTLSLAKKLNRNEGGTQYYGFSSYATHIMKMNQYSIPSAQKDEPTINTDNRWKNLFDTIFIQPSQDSGYQAGEQAMKKVPDQASFVKDKTLAMFATGAVLPITAYDTMKDMDWDMVTLPTFKDLPGVGSQSYPYYFAINKLSKNVDAAMEVLKYLISVEFQSELSKKGTMSVLNDDNVKKIFGQESPYRDKNWAAAYKQKFSPIPPKALYSDELEKTYVNYARMLQMNQMDINTAFRKAEEDGKKVIADTKTK